MRRIDEIELGDDRTLEETPILYFRHLLEKHHLTEKLFAELNVYLSDIRVTLRSGTLVDAPNIDALSSKRNTTKARDLEM